MCGSPTHKTAAWLAQQLLPVKEYFGQFCIKDSFEFASQIRNFDLTDRKMFSFDVKSLFTSVPVDEVIRIILATISDKKVILNQLTNINLDTLRKLLELCVKNVQFLFGGKFYRQIDGVSMGSCLGPVFAEIFMGHLESKMSSFLKDRTELFLRYIDDCYVLLRSDRDVKDILNVLNTSHSAITYTYESEQNNSLPFLDVLCTRRPDGSVRTSIFRKRTWTGLYTHFYSFVPRCHKVAMVKSLLVRAKRICSPECFQNELEFIRKVLLDNGYPPFFIDRFLILSEDLVKPIGPEKKPIILKLPFIGEKSASFVRRTVRQIFS